MRLATPQGHTDKRAALARISRRHAPCHTSRSHRQTRRSSAGDAEVEVPATPPGHTDKRAALAQTHQQPLDTLRFLDRNTDQEPGFVPSERHRSEEHTAELQSL